MGAEEFRNGTWMEWQYEMKERGLFVIERKKKMLLL